MMSNNANGRVICQQVITKIKSQILIDLKRGHHRCRNETRTEKQRGIAQMVKLAPPYRSCGSLAQLAQV